MTIITEDYVSDETFKLLKEKGFDYSCCRFVIESDETYYRGAPTLQMAMKWLREVHHIHIRLSHAIDESYKYEIYPRKGEYTGHCFSDRSYYETYEEACEVALKYCLENLI